MPRFQQAPARTQSSKTAVLVLIIHPSRNLEGKGEGALGPEFLNRDPMEIRFEQVLTLPLVNCTK